MPDKPSNVRIPSTLQRSPKEAQRIYAETLAAAESEYGPGERAARTAYASLKHSFAKVGDHWEPKAQKGPWACQGARTCARRSSPRRSRARSGE
jgi:hypothetical protein